MAGGFTSGCIISEEFSGACVSIRIHDAWSAEKEETGSSRSVLPFRIHVVVNRYHRHSLMKRETLYQVVVGIIKGDLLRLARALTFITIFHSSSKGVSDTVCSICVS